MAIHNRLGIKGEQIALNYIQDKGYHILETNWRFGHLEVDIIAEHGNQIVVIEVKTRSTDQWGTPDESVTNSKIRFLTNAIEVYLDQKNIDKEVRFDIISIVTSANNNEINHIEEAFHPIANR